MADDVTLSVGADVAGAKKGLGEVNAEVAKLETTAGKTSGSVATLAERMRALGFDEEFIALQQRVTDGVKELGEEAEEAAKKLGDQDGLSGGLESTAAMAGKVFLALQAVGSILQSASSLVGRYAAAEGEAGEETRAWASELGELGKSVASLDVMGVATHLGNTLAAAFIDLTDATISLADANASLSQEQRDQVDALRLQLKAAQDIVASHIAAKEAAETEAGALLRLISTQRESGEVQKFVKDRVKDLLDEYDKLGETADAGIVKAAAALGILSTAQEKAAKDAERLADRAEKDAERRAKAEERAAARITKALESNSEKINAQIVVYEEAVKRLDEVNSKLAEAQRTDIFGKPVNAANDSVAELQRKVADLRSQPIIDFAELAKAEDALKDLRLKARAPFPGQPSGPDPNAKLIEEQQKLQALHDKEAEKLDKLYNQRAKLTSATVANAGAQAALGTQVAATGVAAEASVQAYTDFLDAAAETTRAIQEGIDAEEKFGEATGFVTADLVELADGTKYLTNTADRASDGFQKLGGVVTQTFEGGRKVIFNLGEETATVADEAAAAAEGVGKLGAAVAEVGKGEGDEAPLAGLSASLVAAKKGIAELSVATKEWIGDLRIADELVDRISTKLAKLALGED
jgi:hypothetical protein